MTGDELNRTIDFLLRSQANLDVRIQKTNEQLARTDEQLARTDKQLARTDEQLARTDEQLAHTNEQLARTIEQLALLTRNLDSFADTQAKIMQVMTRTFEAQAQINDSFRASIDELASRQAQATDEIASRQAQATDELVARQVQTEEALARLIFKVDALTLNVHKLADVVLSKHGGQTPGG